MGLFSHDRPRQCGVLFGDGEFQFPIVGESNYQGDLEKICGGKCEKEAHERHAALLLPEPTNPYDKHAVCVKIRGATAGYLSRDVAPDFLCALRTAGYEQAASEAIVVGGWHRAGRDDGHFGVKLNAVMPFTFISPTDYFEMAKQQ